MPGDVDEDNGPVGGGGRTTSYVAAVADTPKGDAAGIGHDPAIDGETKPSEVSHGVKPEDHRDVRRVPRGSSVICDDEIEYACLLYTSDAADE